jgi:thiol-disulfide isomerase/thioredoxin
MLLLPVSQSFHVPTTFRRVSSLQMSATESEDVREMTATTISTSEEPAMTQQERIIRDAGLWGKTEKLKCDVRQEQDLQKQRNRSTITATVAILVALGNYAYQYTHPITPIQLLTEMEHSSAPMSIIGRNGKPTVVDFWAPWCENCKLAAPTLQKVEEEYGDRVNFVLINGDTPQAWPYIEAFRVDAIPHLALVNADGDVETALIGPIPKSVLEADIDTMIDNQKTKTNTPLPYKMLDVFADVPENRRVHFDP